MRSRGGLVFKADRWLYHSTLGSRVIKKKKEEDVHYVRRVCANHLGWGLGFGFWGLGFGVWGLEFGVRIMGLGLGFR